MQKISPVKAILCTSPPIIREQMSGDWEERAVQWWHPISGMHSLELLSWCLHCWVTDFQLSGFLYVPASCCFTLFHRGLVLEPLFHVVDLYWYAYTFTFWQSLWKLQIKSSYWFTKSSYSLSSCCWIPEYTITNKGSVPWNLWELPASILQIVFIQALKVWGTLKDTWNKLFVQALTQQCLKWKQQTYSEWKKSGKSQRNVWLTCHLRYPWDLLSLIVYSCLL